MSNKPVPPSSPQEKRPPKPLTSEHFDPLGSYTGTPTDPKDQPQQDADDL